MKKILLFSILLVFAMSALVFGQTQWKATNYEVAFKIKNAGATVTGRFTGLKANLTFDPANLPKSSLDASVEVTTIKTGIDKRDKDLLEEKYFDAGKYKLIEMKSTKLYKKGSGYAGMFNVTIKGVTKQLEVPFTFNKNGNDAEFKGDFEINRRDFGVGGSSVMMSDKLNVSIMIKAKS